MTRDVLETIIEKRQISSFTRRILVIDQDYVLTAKQLRKLLAHGLVSIESHDDAQVPGDQHPQMLLRFK